MPAASVTSGRVETSPEDGIEDGIEDGVDGLERLSECDVFVMIVEQRPCRLGV